MYSGTSDLTFVKYCVMHVQWNLGPQPSLMLNKSDLNQKNLLWKSINIQASTTASVAK